MTTTRRLLPGAIVALVAVVLLAAPELFGSLYGVNADNRLSLYRLRHSIRRSMPRDELARLVSEVPPTLEVTWESKERIVVTTAVAFLKQVSLEMILHDDVVATAEIRDDSGVRPSDSPPDIR